MAKFSKCPMSFDPCNILQTRRLREVTCLSSCNQKVVKSVFEQGLGLHYCAILPLEGNHSAGLGPHPPPHLGAILVKLSALMARNDALPQGSPNSTGDLGVVARDLHVGLIAVCVGEKMSGPGLWSRTLHPHPNTPALAHRFGLDPAGQRSSQSTGSPSACPWRT